MSLTHKNHTYYPFFFTKKNSQNTFLTLYKGKLVNIKVGSTLSHCEYLEAVNSETPNWIISSFSDIEKRLIDPDFPCLFSKRAYKSKKSKFLFISEKNFENEFFNGMNEYTNFIKSTNDKELTLSPLIVFFENSKKNNLESEHKTAWSFLQSLHTMDNNNWPKEIGTSPKSSNFSYCFNEIPLFINMSCPGHSLMKSRNLGNNITFIINPMKNFELVASLKSKSGVSIRNKIRKRISKYNNGFTTKSLGFFGQDDNLEWKQYQLNEPDGLNVKSCPFHFKGKV